MMDRARTLWDLTQVVGRPLSQSLVVVDEVSDMDSSLVLGQGVQGSPNAISADSPAGIHCANPDCRTRAGERSRGHQSCRALLCGHCCQQASKQAAEKGEHRPVCKVHSRRVHTGHRPLPKEAQPHQPHQPHQHQQHESLSALSSASTTMPNGWVPQEESSDLHELLEKRALLERSLKRSLTLVIWYRNGCEPLRLPHEVSTFPLFRLQDFPELIGELTLQSNSYIDCYNVETGQWEQHKITTVRNVEEGQRLLYRIRPSLLDSLSDCPQLDQELALQPQKINSNGLKRTSEPYSPPVANKHPRILANAVPVRQPTSVPLTPGQPNKVLSIPLPSEGQQQQQHSQQQHLPQQWAPSSETSPAPSASGSNGNPTSWGFVAAGTMPTINRNSHSRAPEPPTTPGTAPPNGQAVKKWPTDFSVYEITSGFQVMSDIMGSDPRERQKSAFERVFGCRYVKSTVGRAKLYWKRASQEIKDHFLQLPKDDPRGKWQNFVHLMDGRLVIELGKDGEAAGDEDEKDSGDERQQHRVNGAPLNFGESQQTQMPPPHVNVRPSDDLHPGMPMGRPPNDMLRHPPPGQMIHHERSMGHHLPPAPAPTLSLPQSYTSDRGMGMNRSSSSLSGAMTIAPT